MNPGPESGPRATAPTATARAGPREDGRNCRCCCCWRAAIAVVAASLLLRACAAAAVATPRALAAAEPPLRVLDQQPLDRHLSAPAAFLGRMRQRVDIEPHATHRKRDKRAQQR